MDVEMNNNENPNKHPNQNSNEGFNENPNENPNKNPNESPETNDLEESDDDEDLTNLEKEFWLIAYFKTYDDLKMALETCFYLDGQDYHWTRPTFTTPKKKKGDKPSSAKDSQKATHWSK
ncbi:hypothetical protein RclHR1_15450003 [Rhizophagus clarus]|uniref:Uncharacterized protein n=1 Tax=Rhizophagus clarus TaxID=94130 RepID=A0A2Z6R7V6_9GLOM|nr:hypothetical protein RclHR1_15450003 [Rhizophagus clarus]